jgi:protoheme IX farnesyltransferase
LNSISIKNILDLVKYRVSLAVTFTATTGYLVYTGSFDLQILKLILGIFVLAGGASALNEYQESDYDAKMPRTKNRPIPSGEMTPLAGLFIAIGFILGGTLLLYSFFNLVTALLGLLNIFWYNLVYTNLKKVTPFAVVPGSLTGSIPVLMGWTAAGGSVFAGTIIFIAFFIFIWQVPHFWLLMLKYGKEYEGAGFPTINQAVTPQSLKMIIFTWVIATSVTSILVPLFVVNISLPFFLAIFALNLLFVGVFVKLSFGNVAELNFTKSFISINVYMMLFMILLIAFHLSVS